MMDLTGIVALAGLTITVVIGLIRIERELATLRADVEWIKSHVIK